MGWSRSTCFNVRCYNNLFIASRYKNYILTVILESEISFEKFKEFIDEIPNKNQLKFAKIHYKYDKATVVNYNKTVEHFINTEGK